MLKQTFMYRFEVDDGNGFYCVGGPEDTKEFALLNKRDYADRRDKRTKRPPMRIVEICISECVIEEF